MARISQLPFVAAPVGDEPVVILSEGRSKRTRLDLLVSSALVPLRRQSWRAVASYAEREAIPLSERGAGMRVYVLGEREFEWRPDLYMPGAWQSRYTQAELKNIEIDTVGNLAQDRINGLPQALDALDQVNTNVIAAITRNARLRISNPTAVAASAVGPWDLSWAIDGASPLSQQVVVEGWTIDLDGSARGLTIPKDWTANWLKPTSIMAIGDSMIDPNGGSYATLLGAHYNVPVIPCAKYSQATTKQLLRAGIEPIALTVQGDYLLADTSVQVTAINGAPPGLANPASFLNTGAGDATAINNSMGIMVAGRHATVSIPRGDSALYTVRLDAGQAGVAVPPGSIAVPDFARHLATSWLLINAPQNNFFSGVAVDHISQLAFADLGKMMRRGRGAQPIALMGLLPDATWTAGTPERAAFLAFNALCKATWPRDYVVDAQGRDPYARLLASGDGSDGDNEDVAALKVPRSLRRDSLHLNALGHAVLFQMLLEWIELRAKPPQLVDPVFSIFADGTDGLGGSMQATEVVGVQLGTLAPVAATAAMAAAGMKASAAVFSPRDTSRSGWAAERRDKAGRRLSGIFRATGTEHTFVAQAWHRSAHFLAGITTRRAKLGDVTVEYVHRSARSGYLWQKLDSAGRMIFAQRRDGAVFAFGRRLITSIDIAAYTLRTELAAYATKADLPFGASFIKRTARSGYLWQKLDKQGRIIFGQRRSGTVYAFGKRVLVDSDLLPPDYRIYEGGDQAGNRQIYRQSMATGKVIRLTALGSNNSDPQLTADGAHVLFRTDRATGLGAGILAVPVEGGAERLVTPRPKMLASVGDSLTAGQGATNRETESWPAVVATAFGWTLTNLGMPGFTATSVAANIGAIPITLSVTGGVVAGNGASTSVTAISSRPLSLHNGLPAMTDDVVRTLAGAINGVPMTLRRSTTGSAGARVDVHALISASGAPATAVAAGSVFVPTQGDAANQILTICLGTNTAGDTTEIIIARVDAIIAWARPLYKKIVLSGLSKGSPLNAYWRAKYPQYYAIDAEGKDPHQRLLASHNPADPTDVADVAADRLPTSLSADGTHLTTAGYAIWAGVINQFIIAQGWNL